MDGPDDDRVLTTITAHAASMLAIARIHSLCLDDALDAYQRALEIYLRKVETVRPATAGEWLRTVAKHEAIRLREQRQRIVGGDPQVWERRADPEAREPSERAVEMERVAHAAEALQACKRDESKAILLKAGGASYAEIAQRQGWTATKTNRVLTEGRRTFMSRFASIEAGEACERYAPLLSAVADGEATADDYVALRPHLHHCGGCRETLRGLYHAQPALGALVPAGAVAMAAASAGMPAGDPELPVRLLGRLYEGLVTGVGDKLVRAQALVEAATSTKAGVVAATAAVAAGGAVAVGSPATPAIPPGGPAVARVAAGPDGGGRVGTRGRGAVDEARRGTAGTGSRAADHGAPGGTAERSAGATTGGGDGRTGDARRGRSTARASRRGRGAAARKRAGGSGSRSGRSGGTRAGDGGAGARTPAAARPSGGTADPSAPTSSSSGSSSGSGSTPTSGSGTSSGAGTSSGSGASSGTGAGTSPAPAATTPAPAVSRPGSPPPAASGGEFGFEG